MRKNKKTLRIKHLPYIITSFIAVLVLLIAYPSGLWLLGIILFPILWGIIYKLINRNNNR